tara:strand:- start:6642 stop:6776 length:135 start_codon:yes stop_codon:yes gene_type:complete
MIDDKKKQNPDKLVEVFGSKTKDFDDLQETVADLIVEEVKKGNL